MADQARLTLYDFLKSKDPDGTLAATVELMNQYNPALSDAPIFPSNLPLGNQVTLRRSLPAVGSAKINKGVTRSKSATDQRIDAIGFYAGLSEVDARIQKALGVALYAAKRADENRAFEEALSQHVANELIYGSVKTDESSFDGLATRMASLNAGTSMTASQVHSAGSVTGSDGCSVIIVDWGERGAHLIHPPSATAGLQVEDKGDVRVTDTAGNPFFAGTSEYTWLVGLAVKDPRHIARLANIDLSDSLVDSPTQGKLFDKLEYIMSLMPDAGGMNRVMYGPTKLWAAFAKQSRSASNLALSIQEYLGKPTPHLWDVPFRKMDKMSITEETVS